MYDLEYWEVNDILDNIEYLDRNQWEQTKLNTYVLAQANSRKMIDKDKFMSFAWDKEETEEEHNYEISNEDIERLKKIAERWQK